MSEVSAPAEAAAEPTPPADDAEAIARPATDDSEIDPGRRDPAPELLADGCYDAACSATLPQVRRPPRREAETITAPARLPTRPSASEIASAIVAAQDQIDGCGDVYGASGSVPLTIRIAPSGAVARVAVGQGTTRFRTCVAEIVRRLKMPASQIGTTASFPVLIR
jgi:hypothetical protein